MNRKLLCDDALSKTREFDQEMTYFQLTVSTPINDSMLGLSIYSLLCIMCLLLVLQSFFRGRELASRS